MKRVRLFLTPLLLVGSLLGGSFSVQAGWWSKKQTPPPEPARQLQQTKVTVEGEYTDKEDIALYDVLTEFGAAWTLVFRGTPPQGVREVCEDAMAETPGLVVKFIVPRA